MGLFGHHNVDIGQNHVSTVKSMLEKGQDPKDMLIEVCRPHCKWWEDKLKRCEVKLQEMEEADAEKSCMYPLRDWVTCVDACVNPNIQKHLVGQEKGFLS